MKILTVVGARPQFIKAAVVERALGARLPEVARVLVHTGQHYDAGMSDIFFSELGIPAPAHHLGVGGLAHGAMTGRLIEKIEALLLQERPSVALVYGDTDSTLAGALAAAKLQVPVAHVEAGLRSFDKRMPEEINRVLTDHVSDLLLTPSDAADHNLAREGIPADRRVQVGDVMYDACRVFAPAPERQPGAAQPPFVLCTLHRAATTDDPAVLAAAVGLLEHVSASTRVVIPLHPRTRKCLAAAGLLDRLGRCCTVVEPVGYLEMLRLLGGCRAVVTDSGGLQKEAFYSGRRCLVLRETTEWVELVEAGHARLHPPQKGTPAPDDLDWLLAGPVASGSVLYGGGRAAQAVANEIANRYFG